MPISQTTPPQRVLSQSKTNTFFGGKYRHFRKRMTSSAAALTNSGRNGAFIINPNRLSNVAASPSRAATRSKSNSPQRFGRWATKVLNMAFNSNAAESPARTGCFGAQGSEVRKGGKNVEIRTNDLAGIASMASRRVLKSSMTLASRHWGEKIPPHK